MPGRASSTLKPNRHRTSNSISQRDELRRPSWGDTRACGQKTGLPPAIFCPQAVIAARFSQLLSNSWHEIQD